MDSTVFQKSDSSMNMIESSKNSHYIGHAHTLDDIRANNTPGADGVIEGRSPGGEILAITDLSNLTIIKFNSFVHSERVSWPC